jgi:6-phosphogluconolactonase (cycloisomerase 2 family)
MPVANDGILGHCVDALSLPGRPHFRARTKQQDGSHPHDVQFDPTGRFIVAPDKGLDRIFVIRFDSTCGGLNLVGEGVAARAGAGPRHVAFHPARPFAWVVNELDSTIASYRWDGKQGTLMLIDVVSTLPGDFAGDSTAAEIAFSPATNTLYASNRGHDSIALYRVNRITGRLTSTGWMPSGGRHPRYFCFDPSGTILCVANEQSDTLVTFAVQTRSGALRPFNGSVGNASPVTIAFA